MPKSRMSAFPGRLLPPSHAGANRTEQTLRGPGAAQERSRKDAQPVLCPGGSLAPALRLRGPHLRAAAPRELGAIVFQPRHLHEPELRPFA